jgi:MinD-like ATPase involved in chromosome partitioning or flagellar assembly
MTDFEWPPDEIAGPAEETKPQAARASASVPGSASPQSGVPIPVNVPPTGPDGPSFPAAAGRSSLADAFRVSPRDAAANAPDTRDGTPITVEGASFASNAASFGRDLPEGLPLPPPRDTTAIPLTTAPIPVVPHTPPIPVVPHPPAPPPPAPVVPPPQVKPDAPGVWQVPAAQPAPGPSSPPRTPTVLRPADEVYLPTAEEFARRRAQRPADPVAHMGMQAALRRSTFGLLNLPPGAREQELRRQTDLVRRNFGGLRQITVVNPKGGAGKTVAVLLLAMTFGRKRGGYVLAWDNNETQGTLGMRSQQDFHSRTVRDLLRDLGQFQGVNSRVGDLSQYVRAQGDGMFEVLASDESATAGEMLTADAFAEIREVVSRFYKLIMVDTGNNVRAENWQAAIDATDQLVVTMSARNDSAETAARMLDHLEQTGRQRLVRQAVSIVSLPPSRRELDVPAIERHFAARTRAVLIAPYERMLDTGEPIDYARLSTESQDAWLAIAAAVAEGL